MRIAFLAVAFAAALGASGAAEAQAPQAPLVVFEGENFTGGSLGVDQAIPNLGVTRFNDRIRSIVVNRGTWELCFDDGFRGCEVFGPGRHANLGQLTGRVSSLRPVGPSEPAPPPVVALPVDAPLAMLYIQPGFGGRAVAIEQDLPFLDPLVNRRVASIRVVRGAWVFCTDPNFGGECRVFMTGEYPQLDDTMAFRIASGRRLVGVPQHPFQPSGPPASSGYSQQ